QLMEKVRDDLAGMSQVEMEPKIAGRDVTVTLSPLPAARRKRRFSGPANDAREQAPDSGAQANTEGRRSPRLGSLGRLGRRRLRDQLIYSRNLQRTSCR